MLQLHVRSVHPDQVEPLRAWLTTVQTTRRAEALATLVDETISHETAILIPNDGNPLLVYAIEVADPQQSAQSASSGRHAIDADHQAIIRAAVSGTPEQEVLLDLRTSQPDG